MRIAPSSPGWRGPAAVAIGRFAIALVALLTTSAARAGPILDTTPAISSPRTAEPGDVDFWFSHHFQIVGPKLLNAPTFFLEVGVLDWLSASILYSTNSGVGERVNEVEPRLTVSILGPDAAIALSAVGAWNSSARSADLALVAAREFGPVHLLASARGFSNGHGQWGITGAAALGAAIRFTRHLKVVGDVSHVLARERSEPVLPALGWSAGLAFRIPYTPHEMSLYATNLNSLTLQGASLETQTWRIGFQFLIRFQRLERFGEIFASEPSPESTASSQGTPGGVVEVVIADFRYEPQTLRIAPGTTVRWVNRDQVAHTATARSGAWDSGHIPPGGSWSRIFESAGEVPYYCTLHPFMKAVIAIQQKATNKREEEP